MNIIPIRLSDLETTVLEIGYVGENDHTRIQINCASVFADNPSATVSMVVKPPQGDAYPGVITSDGVLVLWDIADSDLVYPGSGKIQLTFTEDGEVIKTAQGNTNVKESIEPDGTAPTPIENFLAEASAALTELDSISASATGLPSGSTPTAEVETVNGHKNISFGIPAGASGEITPETVTGATPSITGVANHRYICGTVTSISITPPQSGIIDVVFTSGTTPATLTVPSTVVFPDWFDASDLDASTIYEINIADGTLAVVATWGVS